MDLYELTFATITIRLLLAAVIGAIIGIERATHEQPAGTRTHMIICIGAAMAVLTNQYILENVYSSSDPARMGAQVISGIGFLGVGTIIVTGKNRVRGLTTAAGLWASGCVGLAAGVGFYSGAIMGGVIVFFTMAFVHRLSDGTFSRYKRVHFSIELENVEKIDDFLTEMQDIEYTKKTDITQIIQNTATVAVVMDIPKRVGYINIIQGISRMSGVHSVQRIYDK